LERYSEALKAFQEAERIWPGYLGVAPELLQSYADVRARSGDFAGGRALLVRLINRLTGTAQAWTLLNRLADMSARHGELTLALGIYRSVVAHAEGTTAAGMAQMKLNDGGMFSLSRDRYREMLVKYQSLYEGPGDFELRDEALFKVVLLQALYGPAQEALEASVTYGIRYPLGIFGTVVKKIRTDLLLPVYREIYAAGDSAAMMRLVLENREYLASCFSDPDFAVRVAQACRRTGTLNLELPLFAYLAGRSWAAGSAPFMMARIVEDAVALGNHSLAESTGRSFLARFPGNWLAPRIHELLGRVDFEQDNLRGVMSELSFLNASERKPDFIESDYYLGKALAWGGDRRGAERALTRFTAGARRESPLLLDGYFAVADARVALKEYAGALSACQEGVKLASGEGADQFLFKMGGIYLQRGQVRDAESSWEKITRKGNDGIWSKLAAEAVRDLHWDMKISSELPRQSEK
jgi:tetratricopeptide (TPR) repeat protein